jgi:hypothetical protein
VRGVSSLSETRLRTFELFSAAAGKKKEQHLVSRTLSFASRRFSVIYNLSAETPVCRDNGKVCPPIYCEQKTFTQLNANELIG